MTTHAANTYASYLRPYYYPDVFPSLELTEAPLRFLDEQGTIRFIEPTPLRVKSTLSYCYKPAVSGYPEAVGRGNSRKKLTDS